MAKTGESYTPATGSSSSRRSACSSASGTRCGHPIGL